MLGDDKFVVSLLLKDKLKYQSYIFYIDIMRKLKYEKYLKGFIKISLKFSYV